jgi:hypothetical protein
MPDPVDLLHTSSGDVDFSRGLQFTTDRVTFARQKLSETLSFWIREWFLDLRQGVPYLDVYGSRPDFRLLDSLFRRVALATRGVGSIESLDLALDGRTLIVSGTFRPVAEGEDVPAPAPFVVRSDRRVVS